jgi:hypothetical protein
MLNRLAFQGRRTIPYIHDSLDLADRLVATGVTGRHARTPGPGVEHEQESDEAQ